ncbi:hypothetical protein L1987_50320 [Smallanthus sonchifolius]|uniref:Uncharacterized protein n=1 Tax=Smallanthus sonchifolius TaxID=185202 RepID=A0ACB9EN06_9ASTR|nr:hypothetical protein L1987_50320 [Smallanthus sonchifolius]
MSSVSYYPLNHDKYRTTEVKRRILDSILLKTEILANWGITNFELQRKKVMNSFNQSINQSQVVDFM